MLHFVWNKIKNKRWLNICLFMGVTILVALFVCHPMFEQGAGKQILQTEFEHYAKDNTEYPAVMGRSGSFENVSSTDEIFAKMQAYEKKWMEYVKLSEKDTQRYVSIPGGKADSSLGGKDYYFSIGMLENMENHTETVRGESLDTSVRTDGMYDCLVSESTMDAYGLVTGEVLYVTLSSGDESNVVPFCVTGICKEKDIIGAYWNHDLEYFGKTLFVTKQTMDELIENYGQTAGTYENSLILDYRGISGGQAKEYAGYMDQFHKADAQYVDNFMDTLKLSLSELKTIKIMLWAFELPCIVLILLFLGMVSSRMLSLEKGEIAVLRSRGGTRKQLLELYLLQSVILVTAGIVLGLLCGYVLCRCAVHTDGFLEFSGKDISQYTFTWVMLLYALGAGVIAILFLTVPVYRIAAATIIDQKRKAAVLEKRPAWEKYFLDLILVAVSVYLLFNYRKQMDGMAVRVMEQKSIDPFMFLDSSVFLFACALLFVRLGRYFILVLDKLMKKRWSTAMYASFLQMKRTWYKQGVIAVFLVIAVSMGIFDAGIARTMNWNMEQRIIYNAGCDMKIQEKWQYQLSGNANDGIHWAYEEPDYGNYAGLLDAGICSGMTRVIEDDKTEISANGNVITQGQLMAIQTKEFGETARLLDGVNETHWFYALNALAEEPDGVIISSNLAQEMKLAEGDLLSYTRNQPVPAAESEQMGTVTAKVCAIVDCFPGYQKYGYSRDENGQVTQQEKYLIVCNYAEVVNDFSLTPYQIWMRLANGHTAQEVMDYLSTQGIQTTSVTNTEELIRENRNSAVVQVTNGMFTAGFLVTLFICSAGYLIYWIMEIKRRELLYGIYRAMGMRMVELRKMLWNEQFFCSILPIFCGTGIGACSICLFARIFMVIYLPEKHNIGIWIRLDSIDLIRLGTALLAVVILGCVCLLFQLRKMKIAQALRLGDDS